MAGLVSSLFSISLLYLSLNVNEIAWGVWPCASAGKRVHPTGSFPGELHTPLAAHGSGGKISLHRLWNS